MRRAILLLVLLPLSAVAADSPREALMQRDRDFSKTAEARDRAAFERFVAADVTTFGSGAEKERGKMLETWAPFFKLDGPAMTWAPESAEISASGDLGYTIGTYRRTVAGKTGTGSYVTIWKKGSDGAWRVAVDIGTPPSPVSAPK